MLDNGHSLMELSKKVAVFMILSEVAIPNVPIAPVDFYVTDQGYLVTVDNWHNMGCGKALALYGPSGTPVKSYDLNDLFLDDEVIHFENSSSSILWHRVPYTCSRTRTNCSSASMTRGPISS